MKDKWPITLTALPPFFSKCFFSPFLSEAKADISACADVLCLSKDHRSCYLNTFKIMQTYVNSLSTVTHQLSPRAVMHRTSVVGWCLGIEKHPPDALGQSASVGPQQLVTGLQATSSLCFPELKLQRRRKRATRGGQRSFLTEGASRPRASTRLLSPGREMNVAAQKGAPPSW